MRWERGTEAPRPLSGHRSSRRALEAQPLPARFLIDRRRRMQKLVRGGEMSAGNTTISQLARPGADRFSFQLARARGFGKHPPAGRDRSEGEAEALIGAQRRERQHSGEARCDSYRSCRLRDLAGIREASAAWLPKQLPDRHFGQPKVEQKRLRLPM